MGKRPNPPGDTQQETPTSKRKVRTMPFVMNLIKHGHLPALYGPPIPCQVTGKTITDLEADLGKNLHALKHKVYEAYFKPLVDDGQQEAAQKLAEMVLDMVTPKGDLGKASDVSAAARATWDSIGDFAKAFVKSPLVREDKEVAQVIDSVKLGSVPLEEGHDRLVEKLTGWDRKMMPGYRSRRKELLKEVHGRGLLHKIRKRSKTYEAKVAKKVEAMQFWIRKTAPRNLGAGKRDMVSAHMHMPCTNICFVFSGYRKVE